MVYRIPISCGARLFRAGGLLSSFVWVLGGVGRNVYGFFQLINRIGFMLINHGDASNFGGRPVLCGLCGNHIAGHSYYPPHPTDSIRALPTSLSISKQNACIVY